MNEYKWIVECKGFGTKYEGTIMANDEEDAIDKVIILHNKNYNHYSFDITVGDITRKWTSSSL